MFFQNSKLEVICRRSRASASGGGGDFLEIRHTAKCFDFLDPRIDRNKSRDKKFNKTGGRIGKHWKGQSDIFRRVSNPRK